MTTAVKVFAAKSGKYALAEKLENDMYMLTFEDGEQKEISTATYKRWYKEVEADDLTPESAENAPADATNDEVTPNPVQEDAPAPEAPEAPEMDEKAKKKAEAKAKAEAKKAELEKKRAEAKAKAEAKRLEYMAKKEAELKAKEDSEKEAKQKAAEEAKAKKEAEKADLKAKKEAEKKAKQEEAAAKKAQKAAEKAKKEAEKANRPKADGKAKERNKEFWTKFVNALKAQDPEATKANARDRSYMSFPAGASGFKYKFVKTGNTMNCSLYIFGPEVVTAVLFDKLLAHKEEIETRLADLTLAWEADNELKVRRVTVTLNGSDDELIEQGIRILKRFSDTFTGYIDAITK